jgi:hypothetical protein
LETFCEQLEGNPVALLHDKIVTRMFAQLSLVSLFAIFTQEAGALPMDQPHFGYCSDLNRRANVKGCGGAGGGPHGPTPTAQQSAACKSAYFAFCNGIKPGGGRIVACLNQHYDKLSVACKEAIAPR